MDTTVQHAEAAWTQPAWLSAWRLWYRDSRDLHPWLVVDAIDYVHVVCAGSFALAERGFRRLQRKGRCSGGTEHGFDIRASVDGNRHGRTGEGLHGPVVLRKVPAPGVQMRSLSSIHGNTVQDFMIQYS